MNYLSSYFKSVENIPKEPIVPTEILHKKYDILKVTTCKYLIYGKPLQDWKILENTNSSVHILDEKFVIQESGLYHIIGQFLVSGTELQAGVGFNLGLQVNFKSISLLYTSTDSTVYINEYLELDKDDVLTLVLGSSMLICDSDENVNQTMNRLTIIKTK